MGKKGTVVRGTSHQAWGIPAPLLQLPVAAVTHLGHAVLEVLQRVLVPRAVPADDLGGDGGPAGHRVSPPGQSRGPCLTPPTRLRLLGGPVLRAELLCSSAGASLFFFLKNYRKL